jgi:hypothetical protein
VSIESEIGLISWISINVRLFSMGLLEKEINKVKDLNSRLEIGRDRDLLPIFDSMIISMQLIVRNNLSPT